MPESLFPLTVPEAVERIRARNPVLKAFICERLDDALRDSVARANELRRSVLHGVPFSLKDEWETLSLPTTGGSWRHRQRRSSHDSAVFRAFDQAGGVFLGKTNLSDLGLAPEASSWVGGATLNPFDLTRTAGGSSGGAAAAVADGMSAIDWGTDIGGSIRYPAGHCGVFGMKLSAESWPLSDLFPIVPEAITWLCSQGPITRTLPQLRAVIETVAPTLRTGSVRTGFTAREVALYVPSKGTQWESFADDVAESLTHVIARPTEDHDLPPLRDAQWIYDGVWCSHLLDLLAADPSLRLIPAIFGVLSAVVFRGLLGKSFHPATAELLLQIALGRILYFHSKQAALAKAQQVRHSFQRLWDRGAIVVLPVCSWSAPRPGRTNYNPRLIECTVPGNLADATALVLPWGRFDDGLPRAIQLLGPPGSEFHLIELGGKLLETRLRMEA
jgi:Asp-tRNA(Asn)/Glu-tRNA(Gln) amidotransferase A subunit family amidase